MNFDDEGYLWLHDDKDFYKYNGHQVEALGLNEIVGLRKYDFIMYNDIIFKKDSIYFQNGESLMLVDPESKVTRHVWNIPKDYFFSYTYQDELDHIWIFTTNRSKEHRPVFKSEDGIEFKEIFDLNDVIGDQGIFWDFFELGDKEGILYFQWRLGDLLILDQNGKELELPTNDQQEFERTKACSQFRLDNENNLWRIFNKEFSIYNPEKKEFEIHPIGGKIEFLTGCKKQAGLSELKPYLNLRLLFTDSFGRIWIGCAASYLLCYDPNSDQIYNFRSALVDQLGAGNFDIKNIMEDKDGNIWGFQGGGIFKLKDRINYFDSYLVDTSDPSHPIYTDKENPTFVKVIDRYGSYSFNNTTVLSIEEDKKGDVIIQSGVFTYILDRKTNQIEILPLFSPDEAVFLSYKEGAKFFAVWESYYRIEENFELTKLKHPILKIEQSLVQKNGDVWVSGLLNENNYLFAKLNDELEFEKNYIDSGGNKNSLNKVNGMSEDMKSNLWLGTNDGLIYFDLQENKFTNLGNAFFYNQDSFKIGKAIDYVQALGDNRIWFLSKYEIGLLNTETKSLKHLLPLNENIISDSKIRLLPIGDSVVWMGHSLGLSYHNFNTNKTIHISGEKGLDLRKGVTQMKLLSDHSIAVGTGNGVYVFQPDSILQKLKAREEYEKQIPLKLNSFSYIDGRKDSKFLYNNTSISDHEILLNHNDRMLNFEYSLLNFSHPETHSYSYKLEGYQNKWSNPSPENAVRFTSLQPGEYQLMIKASGASGTWSDHQIKLDIIIKQAWYRTYWFILSIIFLIGLLIYLVTRYYYSQKLEKRKAVEELRNKISSDLHDDVGSLLAGLSMKSELMAIKYKDDEKKKLLGIASTSRDAMIKMRDIVWAIDSSRDKYKNLIDRMNDFAHEQLEGTKFRYKVSLVNIKKLDFIEPNVRQNLYLIFKESLTNAIKHSNGNQLTVFIEKQKNKTIFSIKDNGRIEKVVGKEGLGLKSISNRAKKIGGLVQIIQEDGFEIRVILET